jgi:hypothetical protein
VLFQNGGDLVVRQGAAEFLRAVVDFGAQISFELGGDIVALFFRKPEFDRGQVAFEKLLGFLVVRRVCSWLNDPGEGGIDLFQLGQELLENGAALVGKFVEPFFAVVFVSPFAFQESLGFKATEKRVEGAFLDLDPECGQFLAEGVAIVFPPQLGEDSDDEEAAAEFEADGVKEVGIRMIWPCYHVKYTM